MIAAAVFAMVAIKSNHCLAYAQLADIPSLINDAHLTAYYQFEGNLNDSKSTHNGTWNGTGTYGTTTPFSGQYVALNGTSQKFYLNRLAINNAVNTQSLSFWFNTSDNTIAAQYLFSNFGCSASNCTYPYENFAVAESYPTAGTHSVQFVDWTNDSSIRHYQYASTTSSGNTWHNYIITRDGATADVKTYLDGNLTMTMNPAAAGANNYFTNAAANIYIGANVTNYLQTTFNYYFKGKLDDISFWDRALSATEIATIYAGGYCGDGICNVGETSATCPADCGYDNATTTIDFAYSGATTPTTTDYGTIGTGDASQTAIVGHCTNAGDWFIYQKGALPFYISWPRAYSQLAAADHAVCNYSTEVGHTTELIYTLPIHDAVIGRNIICAAEVSSWTYITADPSVGSYTLRNSQTPCINFNLAFNSDLLTPSTATSTNIFGTSNYDLACSAEQWASTSTIPILGWNIQLFACQTKLWYLDLITKPITWVEDAIVKFKDWLGGLFPFNVIQTIKNSFDTSTAGYTSFLWIPGENLCIPGENLWIPAANAATQNFSTSTGIFTGGFTFSHPIFGAGTPTTSFSFFSKANIVNLVNQQFFDAFYLIMRLIIWGLFAFYCYDLVVHRAHDILGL